MVIPTKIRCGLMALSALVFAVAPRGAFAQTAADTDRAEKLFAEASAFVAAGKYAEACPRFEESQRLDGALGTQYNLALCFEKIGKLGGAWKNLRAVERLAHATGKTGREEAARQRMAGLRRRVSHLVLSAVDPDTTIKVDGERAERDTWDFYPVDPGEHLVEAAAPTKESWRTRVTIGAVAPDRDGIERAVRVPALATHVVTVTKETSNARRTAGLVIGGIGVVSLGVAAGTGVMILRYKAIADDRCTPTCADASARSAVATGKTLVPINDVAWGAGIVGVGVGAFLLLTSRGSKPAAGIAWITPAIGPDGGGAAVGGRF
jgi:hypothetical protein